MGLSTKLSLIDHTMVLIFTKIMSFSLNLIIKEHHQLFYNLQILSDNLYNKYLKTVIKKVLC